MVFQDSLKSILVVDDDLAIQEILRTAFVNEGYKVQVAGTADEALKILRHQKIYIFFLDLKLPGMSGIELCKIIKDSNPVAYIYAITGYGDLFDLRKARAAGFDNYFLKPFHLRKLIDAVNSSTKDLERWHSILIKYKKKSD